MSFLKKLGKSVKKAVKTVSKVEGKILKVAAPVAAGVLAATGVGLPVAAAVGVGGGALGGVLSGGSVKKKFKAATTSALIGGGAAVAGYGIGTALGLRGGSSFSPSTSTGPDGGVDLSPGNGQGQTPEVLDYNANLQPSANQSNLGDFLNSGIGKSVGNFLGITPSEGVQAYLASRGPSTGGNQGRAGNQGQDQSAENAGHNSQRGIFGNGTPSWLLPLAIGGAVLLAFSLSRKG